MLNNSSLVGRLTRDPDVKVLASNKVVASFTLAVQRTKDDVDFIPCEVWGKTAESVRDYVTKGALVGVDGSIKVDNYEVDGQRRTFTKVVCNRVHFIDLRNADKEAPAPTEKSPSDYMTDAERANQ